MKVLRRHMSWSEFVDELFEGKDPSVAWLLEHIIRHVAPPILLGFGHGSLGHIFQPVMHGLFRLFTTPDVLCLLSK